MKRQIPAKTALTICLWLFVIPALSQTMPAKIRVIFPFPVTMVTLKQYWPIGLDPEMEQTGTNEYSYNTATDIYGQILFNIKYLIPQFFENRDFYIAGFNGLSPGKPAGIVYGKVYINNVLVNNMYTVLNPTADGLDISAKISSDSSIVPLIDANHPHAIIDDRIPPEAALRSYCKNPLPPSNYHYLAAWMQVLTDNNVMDDCVVEVDYFKLYGRNGGTLTVLYEDNYDTFNPDGDGGLYLRYPFFPPGDYHEHPFPGSISNGILRFTPSTHRNRVWHWWNKQQTHLNSLSEYESYRAECRLKITGHAMAQAGIDCRIDPSGSPYELGGGNWAFENNGQWQYVWFDTGENSTLDLQNIIVENGETLCYDATQTIKVAGNNTTFLVQEGGSVTLIAGNDIHLLPGTKVLNLGYLNGFIATSSTFCSNQSFNEADQVPHSEEEVPDFRKELLFRVFPNPTSEAFTLEVKDDGCGTNGLLKIYGTMGMLIRQTVFSGGVSERVSLAGYPEGVYLISLIKGGQSEIRKIIKVR